MLTICKNSVTTCFAEYSLKHQLHCLVNLYDEFQKLKKLLEPFKQNLIYQRLQSYEATPNAESFKSFKEALDADFADLDISKQALVFSIAHNNMMQSRLEHQATIDLEFGRFKASTTNEVVRKFEVVTLK